VLCLGEKSLIGAEDSPCGIMSLKNGEEGVLLASPPLDRYKKEPLGLGVLGIPPSSQTAMIQKNRIKAQKY
jgi:hypothetical protein